MSWRPVPIGMSQIHAYRQSTCSLSLPDSDPSILSFSQAQTSGLSTLPSFIHQIQNISKCFWLYLQNILNVMASANAIAPILIWVTIIPFLSYSVSPQFTPLILDLPTYGPPQSDTSLLRSTCLYSQLFHDSTSCLEQMPVFTMAYQALHDLPPDGLSTTSHPSTLSSCFCRIKHVLTIWFLTDVLCLHAFH